MGIHASKRWQPYAANERKTFHSALCRLLHTEFPGVFGPTITRLFADKIDELYDRFHPERTRLKLGQVLWTAVAVDDPPAQNKRIEDSGCSRATAKVFAVNRVVFSPHGASVLLQMGAAA